ncbi:type II secretion system secretin GspD [Gilvimarinus sp. SDUM040013]|uniref:Type II secretion system secretin GspD n=1 Tax=Gilvimarinus gilvus TaxID=3058038 RepID=A0ABU4RXJ2_9GAMM|nr:type II secretion system secretin GspD [Gilvimarinus sp. SDUM040013]MDX6849615.1 type II secretion system secretin GspD [Gilvimarinus sp. SDUM040013]
MRRCSNRIQAALLVFALAVVPLAHAEQTWTVNFKDSDIQEVIKFIAEATDKTIIIDPKVRGQVKVISEKPVNSQELYGLFLSILDVHGFTAVENGNAVRIVPNRDARSLPIPSANNGSSDSDAYMTQVIQLENISAAKLLPVLRPLVPQHGHISAYDPSNAIIVTDTRGNIDRLLDVVKQIDKAAVISTELVELRYAQAEAIVKVIQQLEKPDAQRGNASSPVTVVADARINGVLVNGDDMQRQRIKGLIRRLDRPQITNSNVRVIYLKYAKAEQVAEVLNGVLQNMQKIEQSEGAGNTGSRSQIKASVQPDEDTNAILITADGDTLQSLMVLIESLDIRRAQVLVEAIIVELEDNASKEIGIEWMYRDDNAGFGSSSNGADGTLGSIAGSAFGDDDAALAGLAGSLSGIAGQVFGIGRLGESTDMLAVLKLLKANGSSNILSTPSLLTTDNHEAEISVGQNVPFVTGSYTSTSGGGGSNPTNPFNTVERKDVGILLKVTPHVNDGDTVVMDIEQEISSVDSSSTTPASGIITNQRKISTQVMAASGEVVVLGGLIKDDVTTTERKVPILGDIPVLGNLFKSQTSTKLKTNLMVFIRASVVPDDAMLQGATAEKYRHIRNELIDRRDNSNLMINNSEMPMLPEWEEQLRKVQQRYDAEQSAAPEAGE